FEAQCCDRPCLQSLEADRLVGLFAITVSAVLDPLEGSVDLRDQLALAVSRAELKRALGLERRAVGDIGLREALFLEMNQGLTRLLQQLAAPAQQLLAEVLELSGVHELFAVRRTIVGRKTDRHHLLRAAPRFSKRARL